MRCEKCGNKIKELFIKKGNECICRCCIMYKDKSEFKGTSSGVGEYKLDYELTKEQKAASQFILKSIKDKKDCLLNAVTGAGKTEIIYPLIKFCINTSLKIAIAIPRKDVVVELYNRIKKDFKLAQVVSVYGGNNEMLLGDVVIITTHQLFRYNKYFDVIVIDEVDAFPFYKNEVLRNFLYRSLRGNLVCMSATIPKEFLKKYENIFYLNRRYHNEKLDIPKMSYNCNFYKLKTIIKKHTNGILIVYFPTIKLQMKFHKKLKNSHYIINSKTKDRNSLLEELHKKEDAIILSTLVLERGVTFKNTSVVVYRADHNLFNSNNLVQIAGRVGRHYMYPHGKIIFLVNRKTKSVKDAIKFIKKCNE